METIESSLELDSYVKDWIGDGKYRAAVTTVCKRAFVRLGWNEAPVLRMLANHLNNAYGEMFKDSRVQEVKAIASKSQIGMQEIMQAYRLTHKEVPECVKISAALQKIETLKVAFIDTPSCLFVLDADVTKPYDSLREEIAAEEAEAETETETEETN